MKLHETTYHMFHSHLCLLTNVFKSDNSIKSDWTQHLVCQNFKNLPEPQVRNVDKSMIENEIENKYVWLIRLCKFVKVLII